MARGGLPRLLIAAGMVSASTLHSSTFRRLDSPT